MPPEPGLTLTTDGARAVARSVRFTARLAREGVNVTPTAGVGRVATATEGPVWPAQVTSAALGGTSIGPALVGMYEGIIYVPIGGPGEFETHECYINPIPGDAFEVGDTGMGKLTGFVPAEDADPLSARPVYTFVKAPAGGGSGGAACPSGCGWVAGLLTTECVKATVTSAGGRCSGAVLSEIVPLIYDSGVWTTLTGYFTFGGTQYTPSFGLDADGEPALTIAAGSGASITATLDHCGPNYADFALGGATLCPDDPADGGPVNNVICVRVEWAGTCIGTTAGSGAASSGSSTVTLELGSIDVPYGAMIVVTGYAYQLGNGVDPTQIPSVDPTVNGAGSLPFVESTFGGGLSTGASGRVHVSYIGAAAGSPGTVSSYAIAVSSASSTASTIYLCGTVTYVVGLASTIADVSATDSGSSSAPSTGATGTESNTPSYAYSAFGILSTTGSPTAGTWGGGFNASASQADGTNGLLQDADQIATTAGTFTGSLSGTTPDFWAGVTLAWH